MGLSMCVIQWIHTFDNELYNYIRGQRCQVRYMETTSAFFCEHSGAYIHQVLVVYQYHCYKMKKRRPWDESVLRVLCDLPHQELIVLNSPCWYTTEYIQLLYTVCFFPSHLSWLPFCSLSLLVVTQIRGHVAGFSPPPTHYGSCLAFFFARRFQLACLVESRRISIRK